MTQLRNYLYAFERVDDRSNGVADDEDDDDDEEHHRHRVVATLVRRNCVVTLRHFPNRSKDQAVQDDQDLRK